jgi:hypothetical protein
MKNNTVFAAVIFLISCSGEQKPQLSDEEKGNIVMDVKEVLDNFNADVKAGGLTSEFKYLDNSKDFKWIPPGYQTSISYDSATSMMKRSSGTYKEINNSFENLTINALSADTASYTGKIKSMMTDTMGNIMTIYLNEKGKLIRRKDGWKLLSGETTISLSEK